MQPLLMIKYGELGLKGKNKNLFIRQLVQNIERALAAEPALSPRQVRNTRGRIMVPLLAAPALKPGFWYLCNLSGADQYQGSAGYSENRLARFGANSAGGRRV